jgi:sugar-specific transcriptional regulator TrmB
MLNANVLAEIGMTEIESRIYLFLVQQGPSLGSQIQIGLNFTKVPVYRALDALKRGGFVRSVGESRNQKFIAADPDQILKSYDQRMKSLIVARSQFELMSRSLIQPSQLYKDNRITVYEGKPGYRLWMEQRLQGHDHEICEFGSNTFVEQFFDSTADMDHYMNEYIARRIQKRIYLRTLGTSQRLHGFDVSSPEFLKEQRTVPADAGDEALFSIFSGKVGFYTRNNDQYLGVIVDDQLIASLMLRFFNALWAGASVVSSTSNKLELS